MLRKAHEIGIKISARASPIHPTQTSNLSIVYPEIALGYRYPIVEETSHAI